MRLQTKIKIMKVCMTYQAAGLPCVKPRVCVRRECVAARKGTQLLTLTYVPEDGAFGPALATGPPPLPLLLTAAEEAAEDAVGDEDEVVPMQKGAAVVTAILCDWACAEPELTPREALHSYCSGRRCKKKVHHFCFLGHAGEAGEDLGIATCFCQACWAGGKANM